MMEELENPENVMFSGFFNFSYSLEICGRRKKSAG